jgi:hypothetical protein
MMWHAPRDISYVDSCHMTVLTAIFDARGAGSVSVWYGRIATVALPNVSTVRVPMNGLEDQHIAIRRQVSSSPRCGSVSNEQQLG